MNTISRRKLSLVLYINYIVHGIGLIILTQNMQSLGNFWNVPIATVSYVISGIGIGKLIAYFIFGYLSDRFGRKQMVIVGMASYLIFFIGMPFTTNLVMAYGLAILAGVANSAFDAGTYPTFIEMGGNAGASNVFIKAFMSIGEFILPLVVASLESNKLWFGWSFILPCGLLMINFFLIRKTTFPHAKVEEVELEEESNGPRGIKKLIASVALSMYGYTSMAIMILFTQWITVFAQQKLGFSVLMAHGLLSLYSISSIVGVVVTFIILKLGVAEEKVLLGSTLISLLSLFLISTLRNQLLVMIASAVFGFTAAGGVLQVALNLLLKMLPVHKGIITGLYMTFGSIATFTVPIVTGRLATENIQSVLNFDVFIGIVGSVLALVTILCLQRVRTSNTVSQVILNTNSNKKDRSFLK
ncbi:MFS transporter [Lentilactobacillus sp. SPB1-3]|uniref:MFS transporter n=1 Tax=Lentilactobacillus terminaliae TaxID=3003483 RepID=A0ACD5DE20_9LACO|nr:MFS transporter [Lentilactobacillus sp. SPB1-3]MCZ0977773.1 MFS transporter [Lentilactobacillus sp. SPB1-3]